MAKAKTAVETTSTTEVVVKPTAGERITTQLKRLAVTGKLSPAELEKIAELAKSLVVFVS